MDGVDAEAARLASTPTYPSGTFALTHPWRLGLVGRCFGVATAAPERARVLELGAGTGWNAALIAWSLPDAEVVAVDLDGRQVDAGRALAERLGVGNCRIEVGDFVTLDPEALGRFDYVIAHGVYGWVPPAVRERLMALASAALAPGGLFYLATNVLPGSAARAAVSAMMRQRARGVGDAAAAARRAEELLFLLADEAPEQSPWWSAALAEEAAYVRESPAGHVAHEHLAADAEAFHLTDLVAHARAHGLGYVADASMISCGGELLPEGLRARLEAMAEDALDLQQLLDFATGRVFRRVVLARADVPVLARPQAAPLAQAHFVSGVRRVADGWELGGQTFTPGRWALQRALEALSRAWPRPLPFAALHAAAGGDAGELLEDLLETWIFGFLDPLLGAPAVGAGDDVRPRLSPAARLDIEHGHHHVTTLHHAPLALDAATRALALRCDGQLDRAALAAAIGPDTITHLARMALLTSGS